MSDKYAVKEALIPIAWAICKGTLPIIGVTKIEQVEDAVNASKIELKKEEMEDIENYAKELDIDVIRFWAKEMK